MVAIPLQLDDTSGSSSLAYPAVPTYAPQTRDPERIVLEGPMPDWWPAVSRQLAELTRLPWDWDPRGSRSVSLQDIRDALSFMVIAMRHDTVAPWIGPLNSGGIELSWQRGDVDVEAIFDHARGHRELLVSVGDNEWDAPIDHAVSLFATVVDRLSGDAVG